MAAQGGQILSLYKTRPEPGLFFKKGKIRIFFNIKFNNVCQKTKRQSGIKSRKSNMIVQNQKSHFGKQTLDTKLQKVKITNK